MGGELMSWAVGYDPRWGRDIGYGVPAICDSPMCEEHIDRGLAYVCGGEPYGGELGCGLFFCLEHNYVMDEGPATMCRHCVAGEEPYEAKPDIWQWLVHKVTDDSWDRWRAENPEEVERITRALITVGLSMVELPPGADPEWTLVPVAT